MLSDHIYRFRIQLPLVLACLSLTGCCNPKSKSVVVDTSMCAPPWRITTVDQAYEVTITPSEYPLPVDRFFNLDISVATAKGAIEPETVLVDAQMPEHYHGMNYKPQIKKRGDQKYLVKGFFFHMPGKWDISIDLPYQGSVKRVTVQTEVE